MSLSQISEITGYKILTIVKLHSRFLRENMDIFTPRSRGGRNNSYMTPENEARFGRINDPRRCWARAGIRPIVGKQIIREDVYAYGAFCPQDGASSHLVLPSMDGYCMNLFLNHVRDEFPDDFILMVYDRAPCHSEGVLEIPDNMMLETLPPYSPELNPSENVWDDMREKFFLNTVFDSIDKLKDKLCEAMNFYIENPKIIESISGFSWIKKTLSKLPIEC